MRAEDMLPDHLNQVDLDGTKVRKGTIGAFLVNAGVFLDPSVTAASREEAGMHIAEALPALSALGLFEVMAVRSPVLQAFMAQYPAGPRS